MSQKIPGVASRCRKGDYQYKTTYLKLPPAFSFGALVTSQPPEAQAVLQMISCICQDCGQKKDCPHSSNLHFCSDCYEEKIQGPATWISFLHPMH